MTSRTARVLAIATSVSSTAAVPAVLAATGAWAPALPAPDAVRRWIAQPMGVGFVTALAVAAAAALWLLLVTSALTHVYRALARRWRWSVALRLPGPIQSLTAALLGATAVTTATGATAHAAPVTTTGDDLITKDETATPTPAAASREAQDARPAAPAASTYTVRRGDSLCRIAERTLGDADRWPEIYALNRGARFPRVGGTLRDPDLIYPGWTLHLPTDPAVTAPSTPRPPTDTAPGGDTGPGGQTTPTRPAAAPTPGATDPESAAGVDSPTAPSRPAQQSAGQADADAHRPSEDASRGVGLPGGSWVDEGLACAIAAAVALVWAHRRRRYVPRAPSALPCLDDPAMAPMPRVVGRIHRGLRGAAGRQDPHEAALLPVRDQAASGTAAPDDESDIVATQVPAPVTPALASPLIAVWPPFGLGLTGPGAEAAARGFLVSALASGGLDEPNGRSRVVIPSGALVALLGAAAVGVPDTPRLTVTGGLTDALAMLEDETLRRTRVCFDYEVDTVAGVRDADPTAEPLPPMVLIADATAAHERARVATLLAQGQRLDIHGILLGAWPDGNAVVVDTDGTTAPAAGETRHGTHPADIGRLSVLTPAETIGVLTTLAEAHTGEHRPPAPTETPRPATGQDPQPTPAGTVAVDEVDHAEDGEPDTPLPDDEPTPADSALVVSHSRDPAVEEPQAGNNQSAPPGGRVAVRVLGGARILDMDTTLPLRAKALELLVYLVVHDGDAAQDDILDDLLPDAPAAKAPHRLHTYVSALRKALARTGGPATYLTHPSRRYSLNRDALDTDLWRMRDALRDAERATTHADRTAALQRAVDAYDGALADGFDYEWIEAHREGIRRQALDAHLALAAATADPARALAVLEAAIRHDPYAEALYQQAMRAHAALGHSEQIRTLRRTLTRRLDEIDAEPSKETIKLADRLITGLRQQRPTGKPDPRDGRQHP